MDDALPSGKHADVRGTAGGFITWLSLIFKKLQQAQISADEEALMHLVEFGMSSFGDGLLEARDLDDLDDRLDRALEDPALYHLIALINHAALQTAVSGTPVTFDERDWGAEWGRGVGEPLAQGWRLSAAIASALKTLLESHSDEVRHALGDPALPEKLRMLLSEPRSPVPVARAHLGSLKATICLFGIGRIIQRAQSIPPWLARGIAERWVRGLRTYLCILASVPGSQVPEALVPANDRFDLEQLHREDTYAMSEFEAGMLKARDSGNAVYAPEARPNSSSNLSRLRPRV